MFSEFRKFGKHLLMNQLVIDNHWSNGKKVKQCLSMNLLFFKGYLIDSCSLVSLKQAEAWCSVYKRVIHEVSAIPDAGIIVSILYRIFCVYL